MKKKQLVLLMAMFLMSAFNKVKPDICREGLSAGYLILRTQGG